MLATLGVPFDAAASELAVDAAVEAGQPLIVVVLAELLPLPLSVMLGYDQLDSPAEAAAFAAPAALAASLGRRGRASARPQPPSRARAARAGRRNAPGPSGLRPRPRVPPGPPLPKGRQGGARRSRLPRLARRAVVRQRAAASCETLTPVPGTRRSYLGAYAGNGYPLWPMARRLRSCHGGRTPVPGTRSRLEAGGPRLVVGPAPVRRCARRGGMPRRKRVCLRFELAVCGASPSATETAAASTRRASRPARIASRTNRDDGPCSPMIAASSPRASNTGAAIAFRCASRSPTASAQPSRRTRSSSIASRARSVIVRGVYAFSAPAGSSVRAEREQHLPGRRRVSDARPPHPRHALHRRGALHEVDRDRVDLTRRRQRRRLARLRDELLQMRPGDLAQIEPGEHRVPELQQAEAEPVAAGRGDVLDHPSAGKRREQPRHRARVDPRSPGDLVRAELRVAIGQRVEHGQRALDRSDVANGWLSCPWHGGKNRW